jgi:hypothetical protein
MDWYFPPVPKRMTRYAVRTDKIPLAHTLSRLEKIKVKPALNMPESTETTGFKSNVLGID